MRTAPREAGPGRALACDLEAEGDGAKAPIMPAPEDDEDRAGVHRPVLRDHHHVQGDAEGEKNMPNAKSMAAPKGGQCHEGVSRR